MQQLPADDSETDNGVGSLLSSMSISDQIAPISDEELFKKPPPNEDCPICFLRLPSMSTGWKCMTCCGENICSGCFWAVIERSDCKMNCPFCRAPAVTSSKESNKRIKKLVEKNNAYAIYSLGCHYDKGDFGLPQSYAKALEFWHRAADLGCSNAYHNIGTYYDRGLGVDAVDNKAANHYYELAAMLGHIGARYNLGLGEDYFGSKDRALKHWMIAVMGEDADALENIKRLWN